MVCAVLLLSLPAAAQTSTAQTPATASVRPSIRSNRWQEDWSPLADPALRTQPGDSLKYIALNADNSQSYVSLGVNLRERLEYNGVSAFAVGDSRKNTYLLQRLQLHADVHFNKQWQLFVQWEDARAVGKQITTPVDRNPVDLRLAFLAYSNSFAGGTFKARVGRQDFAFDLQRFVSLRDGPNVRQSFDALWADWETGSWRFIGFVSQPVQYQDKTSFDDTSNRHFRFDTLRVERLVFGHDELSAYYSLYMRDNAKYLDAAGRERRQVFDVRFAGGWQAFDWDLEAMGQGGQIGNKDIQAWAVGWRAGYSLAEQAWQPRLGLQFDVASGDRHRNDGTAGTFNPLFPNGYYFSLAGYTGYANLIHVKPSVTLKPLAKLTLLSAIGLQWRQTTADAVYTQPNVPLPRTAGEKGRWTGWYGQVRADYAFNANIAAAVEAVHYAVGDAIARVGGHDSNYLGIEFKYTW
ncbi:alginate export family protein [Dyella tabacisoli]|uniref:Alginate export family protein n=1 Tax=Dyella tabacisoli TaxID=2282381 RepID=A0A369USQ7_9GAMM|nr:alginate export family protein [Dyella tabacisoli]